MNRLLLLIALCCCAQAAELTVVTGSTVVDDLVRRIGDQRVEVHCLVRPGVDPHSYRPTAEDARRLADARLVVINGLGFEGWFDGLLRESGCRAPVVVAARGVEPLAAPCAGHDHDHDHGPTDPHAWHDAANLRLYVRAIRDGLVAADPAGTELYRGRAAALDQVFANLDAWVRAQVATIPATRRVLVTNHEALGYFCRAYGFEVKAARGTFEDAEPDARAVAALVDLVRAERVPTVFIEFAKNPKLVERIAAEAGAKVGAPLHLDGLPDPSTGLTSCEAVARHNAAAIVDGLR
jgi:zinc/manganese transport system substrate-binding protein